MSDFCRRRMTAIPVSPAPRRRSVMGSGMPFLCVSASWENGANRSRSNRSSLVSLRLSDSMSPTISVL